MHRFFRSAMSAVRNSRALSALACAMVPSFAFAAVNVGDIAIIGYQSDDPDALAFVTLAPINAGEIIRFTDSGWFVSGSFRANEGGIQYTFPAPTPAGTVVSMSNPFTSGGWAINNTGLGTNFALATAGDQILAFQGAAASPTFVYAIQMGGGGWNDAVNSNTSALPPGLTNGLTAADLSTPEMDNGYYSGPTTGTKSELLTAITNPANWTKSDSPVVFPAWSFSVTGAGGPAITSITLPGAAFALNDVVLVTVNLNAAPAPGVPAEIDVSSGAFAFTPLTINNPNTSGSVMVTMVVGGTYTANASAFSGSTGSQDSASFTVTAPPTPPVAFAGVDRIVTLSGPTVAVAMTGATVTDVNGLAGVLYEWTPISGPGILGWSGRTGAATSSSDPGAAIATISQTGVYIFTLSVVDPQVQMHFDDVMITVQAGPPAGEYDPPANYYDPARPGGNWLTGAALKTALTGIIDNHTVRSYDDARQALQLLDADPAVPGNVKLVYTGTSVPAPWDQGATWNREHQWPQSLQPSGSMLSDLHHLRACNPSVNSSRGNKPYGTLGGFWDPNQGAVDRGDSSRAIFYCGTRYASQVTIVNGTPSGFQMGDLASMLNFHYEDMPSDFERRRNHLLYSPSDNPSYFQGNRNPFIDHPELVWAIWGPTPNNSTIHLGVSPAVDGSSSDSVHFRVVEGASAQNAMVTLSKTGSTPTTYEAIATGPFTFQGVGKRRAFTSGSQSNVFTISLTNTGAIASLAGSVISNNTDLTSAATGQGSADADDTLTVTADVLAHANPSFSAGSDLNAQTIAVSFPVSSGAHDIDATVYNFAFSSLQALLDIDSVSGVAAPFSYVSGITSNIGAGSALVRFSFDSTALAPGLHAIDLVLNTSDENIPGATPSSVNLRLEVTLTPPSCAGDANGSGGVDFDDITSVLANWGADYTPGTGAGDANADGLVNFDDVTSVLANWGSTCP